MATSPAAPLHLPPIYLDLETMAHQYITLPQLPWENPPPKSPQPTWGLTIASSSRQPQRLPAVCSNIAAWASQHRRAVFCHTAVPNFNRRCAILIWKFRGEDRPHWGKSTRFLVFRFQCFPPNYSVFFSGIVVSKNNCSTPCILPVPLEIKLKFTTTWLIFSIYSKNSDFNLFFVHQTKIL